MTRTDAPAYFDKFDTAGTRSVDAARQVLEVTRPFRSTPDRELVALDVGCGYGYTAVALAQSCRRVLAIEPSPALFDRARAVIRESGATNIDLRQCGVEDLDEREVFDLVVLDNVLEHIPDQPKALASIAATMKHGAALYVLVPNKWWPLEPHYGLPFLSYLPLAAANRYLRLTRRGTDYTDASYAPSYASLRALLRGAGLAPAFVVPRNLSLTAGGGPLHYRVGAAVLRLAPWMWRLAKGFLVVAVRS